ncbi:bifunctional precorrin-2 dehydrogenase/sirohydrochlorin ferrochelatase [bacterium]|nr:bifunctional precorrin-2 dehydrogenase/sirohydrochlorin ferrochelatase [Candidatus Omnitrophota bacterium]MBU3929312.1 bifunctional precorrin-2 dehydrogenase/sirohydrochlorin ferrochelatase [bacterium]MBU4122483.1 bifunctional precorrin-2 dehydrogenase/sirohydrochlorin ferrochelatase [bacterium]
MDFLPVSLNITGKKILIVGGGGVAFQKLQTLRKFTSAIALLAPVFSDEIIKSGFKRIKKEYSPKYLKGFFLVYACTDDKKLNARIKKDADKKRLLVNVADDPANCDFISSAIYKKGSMVVAVSSGGKNVKKTVEWRNGIKDYLNDHMPK